ncbi:hypothetical protein LTR49_023566 [Elasticomyces elasticus]|nr:hypothetical protein LTR49_023566 [Elasticomyces elasticus]
MVYIGRFVTGFASAVPSVVLAGSVEDLFNSRSRVWLVLLWNSLATAGLIFGPIFGVYISSCLGWRWVHYIAAVVTMVLTLLTLFIRESRPSLLLARKVATLNKQFESELEFENHDRVVDRTQLFNIILIRTASLLVTEPIVILVTGILAVSWAIIYLFTEALTGVYETMDFSRTASSLPFLAIGVGVRNSPIMTASGFIVNDRVDRSYSDVGPAKVMDADRLLVALRGLQGCSGT